MTTTPKPTHYRPTQRFTRNHKNQLVHIISIKPLHPTYTYPEIYHYPIKAYYPWQTYKVSDVANDYNAINANSPTTILNTLTEHINTVDQNPHGYTTHLTEWINAEPTADTDTTLTTIFNRILNHPEKAQTPAMLQEQKIRSTLPAMG